MHEAHNGVIIKMVENMLFLDSEPVGMGNAPPASPPPKKVACLFMLDAWFLKIILLGYYFFVAAIIRYVAKVYM